VHKINLIEIKGFQGSKGTLRLPIGNDVNFLIGRNGTGKTRLMKLLHSALNVDYQGLASTSFNSITFRLVNPEERARPYIKITKRSGDDGFSEFTYEIARSLKSESRTYVIGKPDLIPMLNRRTYLSILGTKIASDDYPSDIAQVKQVINSLIFLSWISVHRANLEAPQEFEKRFESVVDRKAYQVARDFSVYFSTLDKAAAEETDKFQQVYLLALLSPSGFAFLSSLDSVNPEDEKAAIRGMFAEFNIKSSIYSHKLENFSKRMTKALSNYTPGEPLNADDFLVLTDTVRIHDSVKEWHKLLEKRSKIYAPKNTFVSILNGMLYRKRISINTGNQPVFYSDNDEELSLEDLSSGEKQLFILMGETLLQRQKTCIFMADEPEISLHIDWQERLVPSLRQINPNAQIVFATHSPDIVGVYGDHTLNLEEML
jgi:hypothetical protein